jgi:hypothetical protein
MLAQSNYVGLYGVLISLIFEIRFFLIRFLLNGFQK